jgi:predicted nucleotidyltransferase
MDAAALVDRIAAALDSIDDVRVVFLFGSRTTNRARPDSDLDVGIAYREGMSDADRERVRRAVVIALTDALGALGEAADVVDLERADSAVAFHAVRDGSLVLARTPSERVRIVSRVARRFDDDAPRRLLFRRAARAAAGSGK